MGTIGYMAILLWLLAIGYWLVAMAIDYIDINIWVLVIGYWQLVLTIAYGY